MLDTDYLFEETHETMRQSVPALGLTNVQSYKSKLTHEEQADQFGAALWMRDPDLQAAVDDIGLAGDLSDTPHDYVAVFNQNTNASKADYWQRRSVTSKVQLRDDGSATVRLTISVHNDGGAVFTATLPAQHDHLSEQPGLLRVDAHPAVAPQ